MPRTVTFSHSSASDYRAADWTPAKWRLLLEFLLSQAPMWRAPGAPERHQPPPIHTHTDTDHSIRPVCGPNHTPPSHCLGLPEPRSQAQSTHKLTHLPYKQENHLFLAECPVSPRGYLQSHRRGNCGRTSVWKSQCPLTTTRKSTCPSRGEARPLGPPTHVHLLPWESFSARVLRCY